MTEAEWNACTDPQPMVQFLVTSGRASARQLRLFACASVRAVWRHLDDIRSRAAVEAAEEYADGAIDLQTLLALNQAASDAVLDTLPLSGEGSPNSYDYCNYANAVSLADAATAARHISEMGSVFWVSRSPRPIEAAVLRDVFGPHPIREVHLDPTWLAWNDGTVRKLAEVAYEERALPSGHLDRQRLAVLADALEEAGCADVEILGHLRGPGPCVRGCCVIDLLLNRA